MDIEKLKYILGLFLFLMKSRMILIVKKIAVYGVYTRKIKVINHVYFLAKFCRQVALFGILKHNIGLHRVFLVLFSGDDRAFDRHFTAL